MVKVMVNKARTCDKLFEETGVEEDHINAAIRKLALQNDKDVMQLVQENMEKINQKAKNAGVDGPSFSGNM